MHNCTSGLLETAVVYSFYDKDDHILYIGSTENLLARLLSHSTIQKWWKSLAYIQVTHHSTPTEAYEAEKALIKRLRPPYNGEFDAQWWGKGEMVRAFRERCGWSQEELAIVARVRLETLRGVEANERPVNNVLRGRLRRLCVTWETGTVTP